MGTGFKKDGKFRPTRKKKKFTIKEYLANEDKNAHNENALKLTETFGTPEEIKEINDIIARNPKGYTGKQGYNDYKRRYDISSKYHRKLRE